MFDFMKKQEQTEKELDLDHEVAKIITLYNTYEEFPFISSERKLDDWLKDVAKGDGTIVQAKYMKRNEEDFLPGELLLLDYLNEKPSDADLLFNFFELELGIDSEETVSYFLDEDYLDILESQEVLNYWPLSELNAVLEQSGIKNCSSIEQAVNKIQKEFSSSFIDDMIGRGYYVLMTDGVELLQKNQQTLKALYNDFPFLKE